MLKDLSNDHLLGELKKLVGQEREVIFRVIEHLREVEARRLHLEMSYPSMFVFATEFLGYSEFEAHTRLQAARLTHAIPEVAEKILSGELNLSVAACAQTQFRREDKRRKCDGEKPMSPAEKREALAMVSNCSRRKAEEKLTEHFGQQSDLKEYSFLASREFQQRIDAVMDEYSHLNYERDLGKLVELLVEEKLAQVQKRKEGPRPRKAKVVPRKSVNLAKKSRIHISIHVKRKVWEATGSKCTYVDPTSGKRCCSTHALELDHIVPLAKGGSNDPSNLTILCDAHNRWKGAD